MIDRIQGPEAGAFDQGAAGRSGVDKMDLHYRQQLSALIDGALAPDEARFLLRRMQHDQELAGRWERWQIAGEVMRGRATAVLPTGFSVRVANAIAAGAKPADAVAARQPPRWLRWGGGAALAASVAVATLMMARQAPDIEGPRQGSDIVAATSSPPAESRPRAPSPAVTPAEADAAQAGPSRALAVPAVASVVVADRSRRAMQRARPAPQRARGQAASVPALTDAATVGVAAIAAPTSSPSAATTHPFATGAPPASRPWPRAVLPQFGGSGALTTDAGGSPSFYSPSFYPFQPRLPVGPMQEEAVPPPPPR